LRLPEVLHAGERGGVLNCGNKIVGWELGKQEAAEDTNNLNAAQHIHTNQS
jgi:hypothetical protein